MSLHLYDIGTILVAELKALDTDGKVDTIAEADRRIAESATSLTVQMRKRRNGTGRDTSPMRIAEGVTVYPIGPRLRGGTNEREDVSYRYIVSVASGTQTEFIDAEWLVAQWEQAIRRRFHNTRLGDGAGGELSTADYCEKGTTVREGSFRTLLNGVPDSPGTDLTGGMEVILLEINVHVRESRDV